MIYPLPCARCALAGRRPSRAPLPRTRRMHRSRRSSQGSPSRRPHAATLCRPLSTWSAPDIACTRAAELHARLFVAGTSPVCMGAFCLPVCRVHVVYCVSILCTQGTHMDKNLTRMAACAGMPVQPACAASYPGTGPVFWADLLWCAN